MNDRVGFMQGRLSPMVDGKIQAFPWGCWREEFEIAHQVGLAKMEWTLDQDRLRENPLMSLEGQGAIRELMSKFNIAIPSVTGDCFMQAPFYKKSGEERRRLLQDFEAVINMSGALGARIIVVPLVDNGRLATKEDEAALLAGLEALADTARRSSVKICFESDYAPGELKRFMAGLDRAVFGVNYDIGNSAALGYDYREELDAYGDRIINVHVKDRKYKGTTVPLGEGAADIVGVIRELEHGGYAGAYILQTARSSEGRHAQVLRAYGDFVSNCLKK